eukprot:1880395-Amphidinium_carterae.1
MFCEADPNELFDNIFGELEPHDVYRQRPPREEYIKVLAETPGMAIINKPEKTLTRPLISFDAASWAKLALELMAKRPCYRFKEVLAMLRGIGGGKTRALEEI